MDFFKDLKRRGKKTPLDFMPVMKDEEYPYAEGVGEMYNTTSLSDIVLYSNMNGLNPKRLSSILKYIKLNINEAQH